MHRSYWKLLVLAVVFINAGCHKPEKPKSAKKRYEEAVAKGSQEQMAVTKFAAALREILQWRQSQANIQSESQRQSMVKTLAEKMNQVPVEALPSEVLKAWESMLKAWRTLASTSTPSAFLRQTGEQAAQELNRQLEAHGVVDIRF